jgi:hypothetical protein
MTNIFDFRPKKMNSLFSDFLNDADDTVEFDLSGREVQAGNMAQHFERENPALRDWSNQELANIYRVKKLLDTAGVPNTLERGITDEGDPWCIFCTFAGDVFIHLCRIDDRYILDSPNLKTPINGTSFADLIVKFSDGALDKLSATSNRRLVQLHQNGGVFLHPSAMLAALIWSIYINSKNLVILSPDDESSVPRVDDSIRLVDEAARSPLSYTEAASTAHFMEKQLLPDQTVGVRSSEAVALRMDGERDNTSMRDFSGKLTMLAATTPVAIGLGSIAIAFGIMSETFFDPTLDADATLLDQLPEDAPEGTMPEEQDTNANARNNQFDLAAVQLATPEQASDVATTSDLSIELAADTDLGTLLSSTPVLPSSTDDTLNLTSSFLEKWVDENLVKQQDKETYSDPVKLETSQTVTEENIKIRETKLPTGAFDFSSILEFIQDDFHFQTFYFGGTQIHATFDIAAAFTKREHAEKTISDDEFTVTDLILNVWSEQREDTIDTVEISGSEDLSNDNPSLLYKALDDNTRAFIEYMMTMSRAGEVEVIRTENELVLLDSEAILSSASETLQMSWTLANGNTVYTIGMRSDYMDHYLIA